MSLATPARTPVAPSVTQTRPAVLGRQYLVSSCHCLATQAGVRILQAGGNAIDGGVVAGIALERSGHSVWVMPEFWRGACTVCAVRRLETGGLEGGADPRRDAAAAGW